MSGGPHRARVASFSDTAIGNFGTASWVKGALPVNLLGSNTLLVLPTSSSFDEGEIALEALGVDGL